MNGTEYRFLSLEDVLELHEMQLAHYGGASGIYEMAAAYAFHIAENQPFIDGNKRTALAAALVFLD